MIVFWYNKGFEAGYAKAKEEHEEWLAAAAKKAMYVPENAPGSFAPCERYDRQGGYCIEGVDCTCTDGDKND